MKKLLLTIAAAVTAAIAVALTSPPSPAGAPAPVAGHDTAAVTVADSAARGAAITDSAAASASAPRRRRINPVSTAATTTQAINETRDDTARINARRRERSVHYHDENGNTYFVDTVTGEQWVDSTLIPRVPRMKYPLIYSASAGINIWEPVMRLFGQHYGLIDAFVELNMHNRYKAVFEVGLGKADNKPKGMNFTYRSPLSVFFRIGADYNFFFNSNPDYQLFAGARYGFSPFSFSVDDITVSNGYWGDNVTTFTPAQHVTAGWFELGVGVRVKLFGPISAGWSFKFHQLLHESKSPYGQPWYIPGFGQRGGSISGTFSIVYTLNLNNRTRAAVKEGEATDVATEPAAAAETNAND